MRTRWLTRYGPEGASSRYRAYQYLTGLDDRGIGCEASRLAPWQGSPRAVLGGLARRARDLRPSALRSFDALVIQKEPVMPPRLWRAVRSDLERRDVPLVWDIDDAVWIGRPGADRMAADMAGMSDVVVAGNSMLASWAADHGAERVTLIPTCFEPSWAPPERTETAATTIRLLWIGSPATSQLLEDRADDMGRLLDGLDYELTLVGGTVGPRLRQLAVTAVPWTPETEHQHLATADYGLALQPRTPYADHKCGFKIVQYMSYGVVPVATDTPVHREIIGTTGHLISDDRSVDAARATISSPPSERARAAASARWHEHFSRSAGLDEWQRLLAEVSTWT